MQENDFKFYPAWVGALDDEALLEMKNASELSYYGHTIHNVLNDIAYGITQCWIGRGAGASFVLLTRINKYPGGNELNIWAVAGTGYIEHLDEVYAELEQVAREEDCRWITGYVDRAGFEKVYKRFEPLKKYALWIKEIENVSE